MSGKKGYFQLEEKTLEDKIELTPPAMVEAQKFLDSLGVGYDVKTIYHIKIGHINYYPTTGSVYIEGEVAKFKQKGLKFLKNVLIRDNYL